MNSKIYQSPFTNRYGSPEMRGLWSELAKRRTWRRVWVAVLQAQADAGLVRPEQVQDALSHADEIDLARAGQIEAEIGHDLMAELKTFAEQCEQAGSVLHWGMTSADVQDNAEVLRQRSAMALLLVQLRDLLSAFAARIEESADLTVMGLTHLQPAEPTTLGYRLSLYAQDLLEHFETLFQLHRSLRGKGLRGAVGTSASFVEMLEGTSTSAEALETAVMQALGLQAHPVSGQIYPRSQDFRLLAGLAGLAASLHKFGLDVRLLQSSSIGEISEPFAERQVGSSAMPFKRNPVKAENLCSLARELLASLTVAWSNSALNMLERSLDDSANRRRIIPEAFLASDTMLTVAREIIEGLVINPQAIEAQLERYGPFAAIERVLTALVRAGADRNEMHERLRQHSLEAWGALSEGRSNPLSELIAGDPTLLRYLQPARLRNLMAAGTYVGIAPARARATAARIRARLNPS